MKLLTIEPFGNMWPISPTTSTAWVVALLARDTPLAATACSVTGIGTAATVAAGGGMIDLRGTISVFQLFPPMLLLSLPPPASNR